MPSSAEIQTMIDDLIAQRHLVATGKAVAEVWREGRRMKMQVMTMKEFNAYLAELRSMLTQAQVDEGVPVVRRRRAVGIVWR